MAHAMTLDCAAFGHDGGDCGVTCGPGQVNSCLGLCITDALLNNAVCDPIMQGEALTSMVASATPLV